MYSDTKTPGSATIVTPKAAIDEVELILNTYIAENEGKPDTWVEEAKSWLQDFKQHFSDLEKEHKENSGKPISIEQVKQYVLNNSGTFNRFLTWIMGSKGGSTLRQNLETHASTWLSSPEIAAALEQRCAELAKAGEETGSKAEELQRILISEKGARQTAESHSKFLQDSVSHLGDDLEQLQVALSATKLRYEDGITKQNKLETSIADLQRQLQQSQTSAELLAARCSELQTQSGVSEERYVSLEQQMGKERETHSQLLEKYKKLQSDFKNLNDKQQTSASDDHPVEYGSPVFDPQRQSSKMRNRKGVVIASFGSPTAQQQRPNRVKF